MRSIVSAVYDVKPGEVWPEESIKHLVDECAANGLVFDVVESIPVTEEIKTWKTGTRPFILKITVSRSSAVRSTESNVLLIIYAGF